MQPTAGQPATGHAGVNAPQPAISRRAALRRLLGDLNAGRRGLQPVANDNAGFDGVLWRLASTESGPMLCVGDDGQIGRWQDSAWHWQTLPEQLNLHALCEVEGELYAVGWLGALYHCGQDGDWKLLQGGADAAGRENLPLFDIAADGHNQLWAVGDHGLVLRRREQHWEAMDSGSSANLRAVLPLSDGRVLAAGLSGTLLVLDAGRWQTVQTNTGCPLVSMAECPDGRVVLVGGEYSVADGGFRGRLLEYSDEGVVDITPEAPLPRLRRVRWLDDALWICGDEGFALHWSDTGIEHLHNPARFDLHDVYRHGGETWFCGDRGSLFQVSTEAAAPAIQAGNEPHWQLLSEGGIRGALRTLCVLDSERILAAGDAGHVLHIEGDELRWEQLPGGLRIHDLWCSSPRNVFAACDGGTLMHYDGESWEVIHRGRSDCALLAIQGFGPHDVFAVGDNGYALRYDGLGWKTLETGVKQELYGLWGQDSDHLLAVGGGGLVLRWNGSSFRSFGAGTDQDLYAVAGRGLNSLLLCGLAGKLIRFADQQWHQEFTGVRSDLHGLAIDGAEAICVGSHGTVLRSVTDRDGRLRWDPETTPTTHTLQAVASNGSGSWAVGSFGCVLRRKGDGH